eukprot:TRINITY_DN31431_c0_g1_i1.p1 TRINITY_DN31431_c0_g1~~TRINITY_DN31431_c0_g1_i1.p1  ORF type:complete len:253 (-),score=50.94 TRINITY_DN31431_c0_g1_i1:51-809(-)
MSKRFEGKAYLITGASSGIGKQIALDLAKEGASVAVAARREDRLKEVVSEIEKAGGKGLAIKLDVTVEEDYKGAVDQIEKTFKRLDGAVFNAGVYVAGAPFKDLNIQDYTTAFDTNVKSVVLSFKYFLPLIQKYASGTGSIVVTSSTVADSFKDPFAGGSGIYPATKSAVDTIVKYAQLQAKDIRINAINPGVIETDMTSAMPKDFVLSLQAKQSLGQTAEISAPVLFLLSDAASFVYGSTWKVDGGFAIKN